MNGAGVFVFAWDFIALLRLCVDLRDSDPVRGVVVRVV